MKDDEFDELTEYANSLREPTEQEMTLAHNIVTYINSAYHDDNIFAADIAEIIVKSSKAKKTLNADNISFSQYGAKARSTAIYPNMGRNLEYPVLGLNGESSEVLEKMLLLAMELNVSTGRVAEMNKKLIRDGGLDKFVGDNIVAELGDVLWYISAIAYETGNTIGDVAMRNLQKLYSRKKRGKIKGSGDKR